jgi:hypothetical protein
MKYDRGWEVWGIYTGPGSGRSVAEPNMTSKVLPYHLEKYSATFLLSKMHWD